MGNGGRPSGPNGGGVPPVLERSRLGTLTKIAGGGQGITYRVPGVHLGFAASVVYKEYKPTVLADVDTAQLSSLPRFLTDQPTVTAFRLVGIAAWPCAIVQDGGRVVGFVMPVIPDRFFTDITTVRGTSLRLAEFQHLLNDRHVIEQRGLTITDGDRYRLIAALATELAFLHSLWIAVGDLSPKNLMFSLSPDPAVYFIDTDAMRVEGASVSPQMESPGWAVPAGEELATPFTDRYKLGLLVLRLLAGDQDTKDPGSLPSDTPPAIVSLVTRALTAAPTSRPAPSDWVPKAEAAAAQADSRPAPAPPTQVVRKRARPGVGAPPTAPHHFPVTAPGHRPPAPAMPAQGSAGSKAPLVAMCVAIAIVLAVVLLAVFANRGDGDTAAAAATPTYAAPTTTYRYAPTTTYPTTTATTATLTSEPAPAGTKPCNAYYSVNAVTTCGFAQNVWSEVDLSELPKFYYDIASPARTDKTFDMLCQRTSATSKLIVCTGGDNAVVYITDPRYE